MHLLLDILPEVLIVFVLTAFVFIGMVHAPCLSFYSGLCFGILGAALDQKVYGMDVRLLAWSFLPLLFFVALLARPRRGKPDLIRTSAIWCFHILFVLLVFLVFSDRKDVRSLMAIALVVGLGFFLPLHLLRMFSPVTRANRHFRLCRTIRDAVAMQVPLSPALQAAAENASGKESMALRRMARWIGDGKPLGEAILVAYKDCPPRARGPILAAEGVNRLQDGLDEACGQLRRKANVDRNHPSLSGMVYLLMAIVTIASGLAIYVGPILSDILGGYAADWPAEYNWARLMVVMIFQRGNKLMATVLVVLVLGLTLERFWPGVLVRKWPFSAIHDFVAWWVPPFQSIHRVRQELILVSHLKSGLAAEQDLVRILEAAELLELNRYLARRVNLWLRAVQEGCDPHQAALKAGIRRSVARVFAPGQSPSRMCEVAQASLKQMQAHLDHRQSVVYASCFPILVIGCGVLVAAIGLWLVAPVHLLTKMTL